MTRNKKIKQSISSLKNNVHNQKNPNQLNLYIDFTKHNNWWQSAKIKRHKFTNFYKNDKHVKDTLVKILFSIFPYVQEHIKKIVAGQGNSNCHIVANKELDKAWDVIDEIYSENNFDRSMEIYQLGVTGGERVFGTLVNGENQYIFCPLFIDCNHHIYPSEKYNQKDFKKFKTTIKK